MEQIISMGLVEKFLIINAIALFLFFSKEIWKMFKSDTKENTKAVNNLTNSATKLSTEIVELQTRMEYVSMDIKKIPLVEQALSETKNEIKDVDKKLELCQARHESICR